MLDSCAMLITLLPRAQSHQARLTFAVARHAVVDIALIFGIRPPQTQQDRLPPQATAQFHQMLQQIGKQPADVPQIESRLTELRALYEPFLQALARHFVLVLPPVITTDHIDDNWQRSAWMSRTPGLGNLSSGKSGGDHFD
jgi:uncharacterized protein (DUF1800 family)